MQVLHTAVVEIVELESVPGFIVFDLPGVAFSAGGTRLAPDVTRAEVALLARAMTYKFAALGEQVGGAKAGVAAGPADRAARADLMARYCAEIRPLAEAGRFLTGPDMGTFEEDFWPLRERRAAPAAVSAVVDGVPFEDIVTGYGVVVAAETALRLGPGGGLAGRSVAIEGFGKVGGGVAREVVRRGGRVAAVSTAAGCVADPAGLDVERLLELRRLHGDDCVARLRPGARAAGNALQRSGGGCPRARHPAGGDQRRGRRDAPARCPGGRARRQRPLHQGRSRCPAPAGHSGAGRLRVQRRGGHRLPVRAGRQPRDGPGRRRAQDRRADE